MKIIITDCRFYNGTTQFARQLFFSLQKMGISSSFFLPSGSDDELSKKGDPNIHFFNLFGNYFQRMIKAKRFGDMLEKNPSIDWVFFADDGIYNRKIQSRLKTKKTAFFVQDPEIHTLRMTPKQRILWIKCQRERKRCFKVADKIVVLSQNSRNQLIKGFPKIPLQKIFVYPLGPHPACVPPTKPAELKTCDEDFLLFFGSIEKYKNHAGFLKMFDGNGTRLIIAGKGHLDENSKEIINRNKNITFINRFISDNEMEFLFSSRHCRGNILPYLDATQSGVLAMGYYYGVPAIVSNDPGLQEFVERGITGFVCESKADYDAAFRSVFLHDFKTNCLSYCHDHMSYETNWKRLLDDI
jgi:glycosyltransferase involved in cell wall biosynthesis